MIPSKEKRMRIGLTGGIASGKTMVSSRLTELGAAVLDADVFSRTAVEKGSEGLKEIVKAFGGGMLDSDGCAPSHTCRNAEGRRSCRGERLQGDRL